MVVFVISFAPHSGISEILLAVVFTQFTIAPGALATAFAVLPAQFIILTAGSSEFATLLIFQAVLATLSVVLATPFNHALAEALATPVNHHFTSQDPPATIPAISEIKPAGS